MRLRSQLVITVLPPQVNTLAPFLLTRLLLPNLKESAKRAANAAGSARVIYVGSRHDAVPQNERRTSISFPSASCTAPSAAPVPLVHGPPPGPLSSRLEKTGSLKDLETVEDPMKRFLAEVTFGPRAAARHTALRANRVGLPHRYAGGWEVQHVPCVRHEQARCHVADLRTGEEAEGGSLRRGFVSVWAARAP